MPFDNAVIGQDEDGYWVEMPPGSLKDGQIPQHISDMLLEAIDQHAVDNAPPVGDLSGRDSEHYDYFLRERLRREAPDASDKEIELLLQMLKAGSSP